MEEEKKEHTYLVSYVVEYVQQGTKKTPYNRFGNQTFVSDKLNEITYENIRNHLSKKFEEDGRVTILGISKLDD